MKRIFSFVFVIIILFSACSKDDDGGNGDFGGSMEDIREFVGSDLFDTIMGLGMTINPGDTPPEIEGKYLISTVVLESSNIPSDYPGKIFMDFLIEFKNQNGLEIDFKGEETDGYTSYLHLGDGSLISGSENKFSVYLKNIVERSTGETAEIIYIFSGEIASEGILDIKFSNFMVDDYGNAPPFIKTGQGRIFIDDDGLSERVVGKPVMNTKGTGTSLSAEK